MRNPLKAGSGILAILSLVLGIWLGLSFAQEKKLAIDFTLKGLKNDTFILSSYQDRQPVVLLFWATWCPYCVEELKILKNRQEEFQKDGVKLFAINVGESAYKVESFIKRLSIGYDTLLDRDAVVFGLYDLLGVPTYIYIDKKGYVVFQGHRFSEEEYKALIPK